MLFGIDYGSKLAGTTVIAYLDNGQIKTISSEKKQDADQFIMDHVRELKPTLIGIDAPLSLPRAFFGKGEDYFYREADRHLKAMSPMFLGGLTARAMRLVHQLEGSFIEVYPGALARELDLKKFSYKKKDADYQAMLAQLSWTVSYKRMPINAHEMDAVLALFITWKFMNNQAQRVGNPDEGLIYF